MEEVAAVNLVNIYFRSLEHVRPLSREEAEAIGRRWRDQRDPEDGKRLAESVLHWAIKYACRYINLRVSSEELVSLASEAVMDALENFDPDKGMLTTYVTFHVRKLVFRHLSCEMHAIRLPLYLAANPSSHPTTTEETRCKCLAVRQMRSIDGDKDDDSLPSSCQIPRENGESDELRGILYSYLERLPPRQKLVLRMRLASHSLKSVGLFLGLSRERIRQIEISAVKKLRRFAAEDRRRTINA